MADIRLVALLKGHGYLNYLSIGDEICHDETEEWIPEEDAIKGDFETNKKTFHQGDLIPKDMIRVAIVIKKLIKENLLLK